MLQIQFKQPKRGDWASTCLKNLNELGIEMSLEEIKIMKKSKFKSILDEKLSVVAFNYLKRKQGSKGKEIQFSELEISDYLLPWSGLLLDDQRKIFSLRNKMVKIVNNFSSVKQACLCGELENLEHLYICEQFNIDKNEEVTPYSEIYTNNISNQVKVLRRFEQTFLKREQTTPMRSLKGRDDHNRKLHTYFK